MMKGDTMKFGDNNYRFQVEGKRRTTEEWCIIGWTDKEDGGSLYSATKLWPAYCDVRVIDREGNAEAARRVE